MSRWDCDQKDLRGELCGDVIVDGEAIWETHMRAICQRLRNENSPVGQQAQGMEELLRQTKRKASNNIAVLMYRFSREHEPMG